MSDPVTSSLALIPARAGSKRLPGKNLRNLQGKPLICWSIEAALSSPGVDRVVVSTDCLDIADIARRAGAEVPFLRPPHLATDSASSMDVVLHALTALEISDTTMVTLLQPTSPLRSSDDIDAAARMHHSKKGDGVVSVCACEHSPLWSNTLPDDGCMAEFIRTEVQGKRSQDLPNYYRLNGAIYLFSAAYWRSHSRGGLFSSKTFAYVMPVERSVDIDTGFDWLVVDALMQARH